MRLLLDLDSKNYSLNWNIKYREAARAIIIKNNKIAMVKSAKYGFYKFPGGGIWENESNEDAVAREVLEETGLSVKKNSIKEFGYTIENRKSDEDFETIFSQKSFYYFLEIEDYLLEQRLTEEERELDFVLEWIDLKEVYLINSKIEINKNNRYIERETKVLELLMNDTFIK